MSAKSKKHWVLATSLGSGASATPELHQAERDSGSVRCGGGVIQETRSTPGLPMLVYLAIAAALALVLLAGCSSREASTVPSVGTNTKSAGWVKEAPVLLLAGENDAFGPDWITRQKEILTNAPIDTVLIASAGHLVGAEQSDATMSAIATFLSDSSVARETVCNDETPHTPTI